MVDEAVVAQPTEATSVTWVTVALGTGIVAASILPDQRMGLGLFLVAALMLTSVLLTSDRIATDDYIYWGLAVVLVVPAVFIAAEWVIALDLMAAAGLVAVHATRASTWRTIFLAPFRLFASIMSGIGGLFHPVLQRIGRPQLAGIGPAARGALLGSILVVVFGAFFVSADAAFSNILERALLPDWDLQLLPFRIFTAVFVVTAVATVVAAQKKEWPAPSAWDRGAVIAPGRWQIVEWGLPLAMLDVLFLGFVAVQITVLFGNRAHVLQTAGLTYAEYARQGFFQLLAVAALTLGVTAAALFLGNPQDERERRVMRILLGILSLTTLVILASAFKRLSLYEATYGFTRLRLTVDAAIIWIAVIFAMVIWAGIRWRASWMPRTIVLFTAAMFVLFTLINPDHFIARENVQRFERSGKVDIYYLSTLSEDAMQPVLELPDHERFCVLGIMNTTRRFGEPDPWMAWNLSRSRARSLVNASEIPEPSSSCYSSY